MKKQNEGSCANIKPKSIFSSKILSMAVKKIVFHIDI